MAKLISCAKYLGFLFLFFIYIYNPPLTFLRYYPGFYLSVISILLVVVYKMFAKPTFYTLRAILPFFLIILLMFYAWTIVYVHGTGETAIGKGYFLFIIAYLVGPNAILLLLKQRVEFNLQKLLKYFVVIGVIQALIQIVMVVSPGIREVFFSIQKDDRTAISMEYGGFRATGLAYGVVWDLAFLQSLITIFITWLVPRTFNLRELMFYAVSYILLLISIFLSGRTGFIGLAFSLMLLFINFLRQRTARKNYVRMLLMTIAFVLIMGNLIYLSLSADVKELINERIVPWAFELFIRKSEGNVAQTQSTEGLKEMYFPISSNTFWLGDGYYQNPYDPALYYMGTDAGYMRQILFYGIIGSVLLYLFYIWVFMNLVKFAFRKFDRPTGYMFLLIAIYFFVAHIKGDIFMGGDMPLRCIFLIYLFCLNKDTTEEIRENEQ